MLKIEIFEEDVKVSTRQTKPKDAKPPVTIYEQDAYVYLGGKFPTLMKLSLKENQSPHPPGLYTLQSNSFIVNAYGSLELKRFAQSIEPLEQPS